MLKIKKFVKTSLAIKYRHWNQKKTSVKATCSLPSETRLKTTYSFSTSATLTRTLPYIHTRALKIYVQNVHIGISV